jgi:putative membrane protein
MYGPWDGGWWAFGMMVMSLVFLALIVGGIVFAARSFSPDRPPKERPDGDRAIELLNERFARGEIEEAEYTERRRILTGGAPSGAAR